MSQTSRGGDSSPVAWDDPIQVLLIDEDESDRSRLCRALKVSGLAARVEEAAAANTGIRLWQGGSFDCVLLDSRVSEGSDRRALETLIGKEGSASVIVLAGAGDESRALKLVEAGAVDCLDKEDLTPNQLKRSVHYALARKRFLLAEAELRGREVEEDAVASRKKDRFLSSVSHELRTPLTAIYDFVSLVVDDVGGAVGYEQKEYLRIALRNTRRLGRMIDNLLEITRSEIGKLPIHLCSCDLTEIAEKTREALVPQADAAGLALTAELDRLPRLPKVLADPARVSQILSNLVDNAMRFTSEGGDIGIYGEISKADPRFVCIEVRDNGSGIPPEEAEHIFEQLYQGDNELDANRRGLGLGLFIARDLVLRQGGRIWVKSELGLGSSFFFTLPVYSLLSLLMPVLTPDNLATVNMCLVVVEIEAGPRIRIGTGQRHVLGPTRDVIAACLLPDKDILLPAETYPGVKEVFVIAAWANRQGAGVLADRILRQLGRAGQLATEGLKAAARVLGPVEVRPAADGTAPEEALAGLEHLLADELWRSEG